MIWVSICYWQSKSIYLQILGKRLHSIWESAGLKNIDFNLIPHSSVHSLDSSLWYLNHCFVMHNSMTRISLLPKSLHSVFEQLWLLETSVYLSQKSQFFPLISCNSTFLSHNKWLKFRLICLTYESFKYLKMDILTLP